MPLRVRTRFKSSSFPAAALFALTLVGCGSFGYQDNRPDGFLLPSPAEWSMPARDSAPLPGSAESVYFTHLEQEDAARFYLPAHVIDRKQVAHRLYYYRFFPGGRVLFSPLPVNDGLADRLRSQGKTLRDVPRIDFDSEMAGIVGRYEIQDGKILIELFTPGRAHWSYAGMDYHYRVEEGLLTDTGFAIHRIRTRHWNSCNDQEISAEREFLRLPVLVPFRRQATW